MNFRRLFKRHATGGVIRTIRGITELDWWRIHATIKKEYDDIAAKHKKPTEYMRGLAFAIKAIEAHAPYEITTEVQ